MEEHQHRWSKALSRLSFTKYAPPPSPPPRASNTDALVERLQHILVFELHANGEREIRTTSLRTLYNDVLAAITLRKEEAGANLTPLVHPDSIRKTHMSIAVAPRNLHHKKSTSLLKQPEFNIIASLTSSPEQQQQQQGRPTSVPYRVRLGGYLHPRDMRRLVTPFSSTNVPVLMVRRHVMLLNFDPLRAIVLRDRLLLLVPDGADDILARLETRLRGGLEDLEDDVFGQAPPVILEENEKNDFTVNHGRTQSDLKDDNNKNQTDVVRASPIFFKGGSDTTIVINNDKTRKTSTPEEDSKTSEEVLRKFIMISLPSLNDEFNDIDQRNFTQLPFELLAVDVVLESVVRLLREDAKTVCESVETVIKCITSEGKQRSLQKGRHNYENLQVLKDQVSETQSRVRGFERALSQILDVDADMALMNLSRLLTHPERFVFPVSQHILNQEADEPELILQAYLEQAFSACNSLDLIVGKIASTEVLVELKLDTIRNRLLFVNTFFSLVMLFLGAGGLVGSFFGMNLNSNLSESPTAFSAVVTGTVVGGFILFCLCCFVFWKQSTWLLQS